MNKPHRISSKQWRDAAFPAGLVTFLLGLLFYHPLTENTLTLWPMFFSGVVMVFFGLVMPLIAALDE